MVFDKTTGCSENPTQERETAQRELQTVSGEKEDGGAQRGKTARTCTVGGAIAPMGTGRDSRGGNRSFGRQSVGMRSIGGAVF